MGFLWWIIVSWNLVLLTPHNQNKTPLTQTQASTRYTCNPYSSQSISTSCTSRYGVSQVDAVKRGREDEGNDDRGGNDNRSTSGQVGNAGGHLSSVKSAGGAETVVHGTVVSVRSFPSVSLGVDIRDFESSGHVGYSQVDAGANKLRNYYRYINLPFLRRKYFRYIDLLSYSTKWQIYEKKFCSFFVRSILSIAGGRRDGTFRVIVMTSGSGLLVSRGLRLDQTTSVRLVVVLGHSWNRRAPNSWSQTTLHAKNLIKGKFGLWSQIERRRLVQSLFGFRSQLTIVRSLSFSNYLFLY